MAFMKKKEEAMAILIEELAKALHDLLYNRDQVAALKGLKQYDSYLELGFKDSDQS